MPCPHLPDAHILVTAQDPGQCSLKPGGGTASHILWEGREKISLHLGGAARAILLCCWIKEVFSWVLYMPQSPALLNAQPTGRKEIGLMRAQEEVHLEEVTSGTPGTLRPEAART